MFKNIFNNNKSLILVVALFIAATSAIVSVAASGRMFHHFGNKAQWQASQVQREADRTQLNTAIESGNFDTFKQVATQLPMGKKLLEKITADNFSRFLEAHNDQKQAMDLIQKSQAIMKELGFTNSHEGQEGREGFGRGGRFMMRGQPQQ